MFVGVESPFTFGGWAVFNTTFLAAASGLAYLAVDPLLRAVYVLRLSCLGAATFPARTSAQ